MARFMSRVFPSLSSENPLQLALSIARIQKKVLILYSSPPHMDVPLRTIMPYLSPLYICAYGLGTNACGS